MPPINLSCKKINMKSFLLPAVLLFNFIANAQIEKVQECIILDGVLKLMDIDYNMQTGEKTFLLNGVSQNYTDFWNTSKDYAGATKWYINNEAIVVKGVQYVKYGLPRILSTTDVVKTSSYKGVGVYAEPGSATAPDIIYIPTITGCEFQPYQKEIIPCTGKLVIKSNSKTIKSGKNVTFTVIISGAKESFKYSWWTSAGKIVGAKNGKSITVSTSGISVGDVKVGVDISGKTCTASQTMVIKVE
jgi:hypothetical protein